jgi:hypothetical protein
MRELRQIDTEYADNLTREIVTKASGVFLWVKLAVHSLLDGFTNRDCISDLQIDSKHYPLMSKALQVYACKSHPPVVSRAVVTVIPDCGG